ncbi:MAG: glycosyltransferase [Thermus sp.]|uniref:glycosyltransferase n=1 Tax=Thermus TaxID=270 RepID=UPI001FA96CBB|nr:glycosyltransferase [Thermus thalpophilus]
MDLLLLTSAYEGLPYVLLEAFALGLPVVSAPTPGLGAWLREAGLAHVAEGARPESLAQAMEAALASGRLGEGANERGLAWARAHGLEAMREATLDLYLGAGLRTSPFSSN